MKNDEQPLRAWTDPTRGGGVEVSLASGRRLLARVDRPGL